MFSNFEEKGYSDILISPEGYELNRIVATTYSLEPQLIYLLACMFDYESNEYINLDLSIVKTLASFGFEINVADLMEQKRLLIFYQQDKFSCNLNLLKDKKFTALLRECCIPIKKEEFAFHPKIILAEYIRGEAEIIHRLIISSRNLTMSDLFETQVVLENKPAEKLKIDNLNNIDNLIKFVNNSEKKWTYNDKSVSTVKLIFQSPNTGIKLADSIFNEGSSIVVLSPYYSGLNDKNFEKAEFYTGDNLHSKIFCITHGEKSTLWVGSANCTTNGLRNNYECMAGLVFEGNIQEEFKKWLKGYGFTKVEKPTVIETGEENSLETIVRNINFRCDVKQEKDSKYEIEITMDVNSSDVIKSCSIELLGLRSKQKLDAEKITFLGVEKNKITNALLLKDEKNNSRVVLAEVSENMRNLLSFVTNELAQEKIDQLMPDFIFESRSNSDDNDEDDGATNIDQKESMGFSSSDEEYEKIMKLYAYNRVDLLQKIKEKLEKNREMFIDEKCKVVECLIKSLVEGADE